MSEENRNATAAATGACIQREGNFVCVQQSIYRAVIKKKVEIDFYDDTSILSTNFSFLFLIHKLIQSE